MPARAADAPDIGRLRPQPYWSMRGPQLATGLIVWSHGYMAGKNATDSAPQSWVGRFTRLGYDLYRFDREWISDWASDATALADRGAARPASWAIAASCWPASRPAPGCRWRPPCAAPRSTA